MKKIFSSVVAGLFAVSLLAFPVLSSAQDQTGPMLQDEEPSAPATQPKKSTTKKTTKSQPKKKSSKKASSKKKGTKKGTKTNGSQSSKKTSQPE